MKGLYDLIYHRKRERLGLSVMLLLILAALLFRYYYLSKYEPPREEYADLITGADFVDITKPEQSKTEWIKEKSKPVKQKHRFTFDPNTISPDSLTMLGFPSFIGKNLKKYRDKGGYITTAEDFKKIYGVEKNFDEIKDLIKIPPRAKPAKKLWSNKSDTTAKKKEWPKEEDIRKVVEINTADSVDLLYLKGVGPFLAKTILERRERLGGYYQMSQLTEAYAVTDTTLELIGAEWLQVDTTAIKKINLNTADFRTLIRHPYISKNQTKAFISYRKVHGNYKSVADIKKIHLISEEDYQRLKYYLTI